MKYNVRYNMCDLGYPNSFIIKPVMRPEYGT